MGIKMTVFEYKVVAAPKRGLKGKGIKGDDARFANAMASVMNELGAQGWQYQRSDTLPCEKRSGLRGYKTTFQNMLVFCREIPEITEAAAIGQVTETAVDVKEMQVTEEPPLKADTTVVAQTSSQPPAPFLNGTNYQDTGGAPNLGSPASEAREVQDPRLDPAQ